MATLVELREMGDEKLEELLENAREEMFNLRFQQASTRLKNVARLRVVRREIARLETILHMRWLATQAAAEQPEIAAALADTEWQAEARFSYEDSAWVVRFATGDGEELATARVNLNKKRPSGRRGRRSAVRPNLVQSYEVR